MALGPGNQVLGQLWGWRMEPHGLEAREGGLRWPRAGWTGPPGGRPHYLGQ